MITILAVLLVVIFYAFIWGLCKAAADADRWTEEHWKEKP